MDLHAITVTAPDGTVWQVSPLWKGRRHRPRVPSAWRRRKRGKDREWPLDALFDFGAVDDLVAGIVFFVAFIVVIALAWFVVWPLLALATELMIVLILVVGSVIGRLVFGHHWIIEADASDGRRLEWRCRGYGTMRRVIRELGDSLIAGHTEPVALGAERIDAAGR